MTKKQYQAALEKLRTLEEDLEEERDIEVREEILDKIEDINEKIKDYEYLEYKMEQVSDDLEYYRKAFSDYANMD